MGALLVGETHNGSLTTNLFNVYIQYKKDTRDVVSWLLSHHSPKGANARTRISVRNLIAIAEHICAEATDMPEVIAFQFRQAIAARNYLSTALRRVSKADGEPLDTENHEFFTSSLTKIYTDLCKYCYKRKDTCNHQGRKRDDISHSRTRSNFFDTLQQRGTETENSTSVEESSYQNKDTEHEHTGKDVLSDEAPSSIVDDRLSDAFELYQQVIEFHKIFIEVQAVWQKAAQGTSHLVTAAAVTNAAYTRLEEVEQRLCNSCKITDPADLLSSYKRLQETFDHKDATDTASELSTMDIIAETNECWQAMLSFRSAAAEDGFAGKAVRPQVPTQVSLRQGPDASTSDALCRSALLADVAQCITGSRLHNSLIHSGSPVVPEISLFISHEKTPNNCLHCASGLALLMSSYKAYSFAMPAGQRTSSCRVNALRFAQSVIAQLDGVLDDPTMPCRCHGTLAFHLEQLKRNFEDYLRMKTFDLFFQSPWVCGGQILQMMQMLNYYGLRLFAYKSYVGSVIHMYNVLRQLHGFAPIAILDAVSDHFGNLLFPGGQPRRRNFRNCYIRYLGGRLRFHNRALHQNGCHGLSIPVHTAKATAGFSSDGAESDARFDGGRFSLLYKIQAQQYRIDEATWDVISCKDHWTDGEYEESVPSSEPNAHASSPRKQRSSGGITAFQRHNHSSTSRYSTDTSAETVSRRLQGLQQTLDAELKSSLPVAGVELLRLYLTCARIIDRISNAYHGSDAKTGQYCLCCAENLVEAADSCREGKGWKVQKKVVDLIEVCEGTIEMEFGSGKQ
ncbi:MAG: hypothetical protein L6R35_005267 [Caloplaca aegaea]|nr:MAG: hypothetical protein L6R35_005267 [Caloplaca aegaea]